MNSPQSPQSPSAFARKYTGHSNWNFLRSGYTPIESAFPNNLLRNRAAGLLSDDEQSKRFQRATFQGFTTRDLIDLDAISDRKLKTPNLENPIAPFLDIDPTYTVDPDAPEDEDAVLIEHPSTWDDGESISIPPPFELPVSDLHLAGGSDMGSPNSHSSRVSEYWVSSNPRVKEIMKPILVLASRLILTSAYTPFFNAIFFAERRNVDPDRVPDHVRYPAANYQGPAMDQLFQVHPQAVDPNNMGGVDRGIEEENILSQLVRYLKFGFMDGERDPLTGGREFWHHAVAYTSIMPRGYGVVDNIWIHLHINMFLPLLRDELTDSERLGLMWLNAGTIVHECAHAFDFLARMREDSDANGDLYMNSNYMAYYGNDPLAEIGWAMEYGVGDGPILDILHHLPRRPIPPLGFWRIAIWPTKEHMALSPDIVLKYPLLTDKQERYPVPVSLIEDIHQENFWQALTIFNAKIHDMRRTPVGVELTVDEDGIIPGADIWLLDVEVESRVAKIRNMMRMSPTQQKALAVGEELIRAAEAGQKYWDGTRGQIDDTDAILQEIKDHFGIDDLANPTAITRTTDEQREFYEQIIMSLRTVAYTHWFKIQGLLDLEQSSNRPVIFLEQRADLVTFNRGVREYLKQLDNDIQNFQDVNPTTQAFAIDREGIRSLWKGTELARLKIWDPTGVTNGPSPDAEDDLHIESIINLIRNQDLAAAATQAQELLRPDNIGLSWFNLSRLRIIVYKYLDKLTPESIEQQRDDLIDASADLTWMRDEPKNLGGCTDEWADELDRWIEMAKEVLARLDPGSSSSQDPRLRRYRDRSEMTTGIRDDRDDSL